MHKGALQEVGPLLRVQEVAEGKWFAAEEMKGDLDSSKVQVWMLRFRVYWVAATEFIVSYYNRKSYYTLFTHLMVT